MELDWSIYVCIGVIIGFWTYYILDLIVLKTYARRKIIKEFYDIADEMGYNVVKKEP